MDTDTEVEIPKFEKFPPVGGELNGIKTGAARKEYPTEVVEAAYQLRKKGLTYDQMAAKLDISRDTLQRWNKRERWDKRLRLDRGKLKAGQLIEPSDMSFVEKQDKFREGMATQALRLPEIMQGLDDDELIRSADKIKNLHAMAVKDLNLEKAKPANVINVTLLSRPVPAQVVDSQETPALPDAEAELVEDSGPTERVPNNQDADHDPANNK